MRTAGWGNHHVSMEAVFVRMPESPHASTPMKSAKDGGAAWCSPSAFDTKIPLHPRIRASALQVVVGMVDQRDQSPHRDPGARVVDPATILGLCQRPLTLIAIQKMRVKADPAEQAKAPSPGQHRGETGQQHQFDQIARFVAQALSRDPHRRQDQ